MCLPPLGQKIWSVASPQAKLEAVLYSEQVSDSVTGDCARRNFNTTTTAAGPGEVIFLQFQVFGGGLLSLLSRRIKTHPHCAGASMR